MLACYLNKFKKNPMKKIFLFAVSATLLTTIASAQSFHFGLKLGADFHKIDGAAFKDEFNLGYHAGAFAEIGLAGKLGVQPEVYFSQVNVDTASEFSSIHLTQISKVQLKYIAIPVL